MKKLLVLLILFMAGPAVSENIEGYYHIKENYNSEYPSDEVLQEYKDNVLSVYTVVNESVVVEKYYYSIILADLALMVPFEKNKQKFNCTDEVFQSEAQSVNVKKTTFGLTYTFNKSTRFEIDFKLPVAPSNVVSRIKSLPICKKLN